MLKSIRIFYHRELDLYIARVISQAKPTRLQRLMWTKPPEEESTLVAKREVPLEWFVAPSFVSLNIDHNRSNRRADQKLTEMVRKQQHYWER